MIKSSIGIVVCRIGAVLLFVEALQGGVTIFTNYTMYPEVADKMNPIFVGLAIMFAAPAIAGVLLWVLAETIAKVGDTASEPRLDKELGRHDLVSIGTYLIGVCAVVFGIVRVLEWESFYLFNPVMSAFSEIEGYKDSSGARLISTRIAYSGQIVLGAIMIWIGRRQ